MSKLTREQFIETVQTLIGDRTDDEALIIAENMRDTYDDMDKASKETDDWKNKYDNLDKDWRTKYRNAFYSTPKDTGDSDIEEDDDKDTKNDYTFEKLFKEGDD